MKAIINKKEILDFFPDEYNPLKGADYTIELIEETGDNVLVSMMGKKYRGRLLKYNLQDKTLILKVDGNRFDVKLEDEHDELLKSLNMIGGANKKVKEIKAPMPGVVFDIKLKPGDTVGKDEPVLILEAMKMENILKSPIEGTIKNILVEKGETVEKNRVLVEFE